MLFSVCIVLMARICYTPPATAISKPCQVILSCPDRIDITYATDNDGRCYIFANACALRNENCFRHNIYFKTLHPITLKECQTMCDYPCTEPGSAFCGLHGKTFHSFANYCEWTKLCCKTGMYYKQVHAGPCLQEIEDDVSITPKL